jgi:hypothetical protein
VVKYTRKCRQVNLEKLGLSFKHADYLLDCEGLLVIVEEYLKKWMYVGEDLTPLAPIYTKKDLDTIKDFTDKMSIHVFDVVNENLDRIKSAFKECKASGYADFAEFFCWFYHLLFSETLDYLWRNRD